jgi:hypothetical protein
MKRLIIFLLLSFPLIAQAQEDEPGLFNINKTNTRKNVISLSPFQLLGNQFVLGLERSFPNISNFSIKFSAGLTLSEKPSSLTLATNFYSPTDLIGFMGEIQPRFYLGSPERVMNSFYFAPYFTYRHINFVAASYTYYVPDPWSGTTETKTELKVNAQSYAGGLMIGYQMITYSRFTMDVYTGGGFSFAESNHSDIFTGAFSPYVNGVRPRFGINVGLVF